MRNSGLLVLSFLLLFAAAIMLACGSGSAHIPQSVTVSPATASPSNGQAQFTATAYFNVMPSPVTPAAATWSACGGAANLDTSGVSISTTGLAHCSAGPSRTYTIFAFVPDPAFKGVCSAESPCGGSCGGVVGTATLTCQ
jgi:hypothetical protein